MLYPLRFAKACPVSMVILCPGIPINIVLMRVEDKNKTSRRKAQGLVFYGLGLEIIALKQDKLSCPGT